MRWLPVITFCLGATLAWPGESQACSLVAIPHRVGAPVDPVPRAVFEARVVEVRDIDFQVTSSIITQGQEATAELIRPFHGPYRIGERFKERYATSGCGKSLAPSARVVVYQYDDRSEFRFSMAIWDESEKPGGPFAEIAYVDAPARLAKDGSLDGVRIRGSVTEQEAGQLFAQARANSRDGCEVIAAEHYAQVGCGSAYEGADVRTKVIFERDGKRWIEVLRYVVPEAIPAGASAGSTS